MDERLRETLINRMLEGIASDDEIGQIESLLETDSAALEEYLDLTSIHSMLQWRLGDAAPRDSSSQDNWQDVSKAQSEKPRSPVLGFLGGFSDGFGSVTSFTPTLWALLILLTGTLFSGVVMAVVAIRGIHVKVDQSDVADGGMKNFKQEFSQSPPLPLSQSPPLVLPSPSLPGVAKFTNMADCQWVVALQAPKPGDRLLTGQSLQLSAGVACMEFDVGATLMVQGPAQLSIVSGKQIRLERGKLAAEIKSPKAHGFTVITPQGSVVDLGTEFGVEVAPQGRSKVHVFRGKVEFAPNSADGKPPLTTQCLLAHSGARMDAEGGEITLVEETGETFVRSLDRLEKDRHVVAYWRFEDRPLGTVPPHTVRNTEVQIATVDSSYNGNDLYAWSPDSRPTFSGDVSRGDVPQTHSPNHACLDYTTPPPVAITEPYASPRNVYTHSAFSHSSPLDIQKLTPAQWTIEASAKPVSLGVGPQTIIGRDTHFPPSNRIKAPPQRLALELNKQNRFAVRFYDASNRVCEAVAEQLPVESNRWYHLAAVSDGKTLKLYIDSQDGHGYQLRASKVLPKTGNTALGKGADNAEWTIGRGLDNGLLGAGFRGRIDEIRVSDIARQPAEFLFAPAKPAAVRAARIETDGKKG